MKNLTQQELKDIQGGGIGDWLLDQLIDTALDKLKKLIPTQG